MHNERPRELAVQAVRSALDATGLTAQDVGGLVTVHDTAPPTSEPLTVHLIRTLGLPPVSLAQQSSVGGLQALVIAAEQMARPGKPVLVVGAEPHRTLRDDSQIPLKRCLTLADGARLTTDHWQPLLGDDTG